jgi:hypothetical protein
MILLQQNKKKNITKLHSEPDKAFKMNEHQVPLRQSVEEIRLGKE